MISERLLYFIDQTLDHFDFEKAYHICEALGLTYGDLPPISKKYIPDENQLRSSVKDNLIDLIEYTLSENKLYGEITGGYFNVKYYITEDNEDVITIDFQPLSLEMRFEDTGTVSAITGDLNSDWKIDN